MAHKQHTLACLEEIGGQVATTRSGKPVIHPPVPFSARLYAATAPHGSYNEHDHLDAMAELRMYSGRVTPLQLNAPPGHLILPEHKQLNDALREAASWHSSRKEAIQRAASHGAYVKRSLSEPSPGGSFEIAASIGDDVKVTVRPTEGHGSRYFVVEGPRYSRYGNKLPGQLASWGTVSFDAKGRIKGHLWQNVKPVRDYYWKNVLDVIEGSGRRP
jgi:hypothetical protein